MHQITPRIIASERGFGSLETHVYAVGSLLQFWEVSPKQTGHRTVPRLSVVTGAIQYHQDKPCDSDVLGEQQYSR